MLLNDIFLIKAEDYSDTHHRNELIQSFVNLNHFMNVRETF